MYYLEFLDEGSIIVDNPDLYPEATTVIKLDDFDPECYYIREDETIIAYRKFTVDYESVVKTSTFLKDYINQI